MNSNTAQKPNNTQVTPLLKEIFASSGGKLWEAVSISLITNILAMAVPIFTMQIYDRVVVHKGITTLQGMVVIIAVVIIFDSILRFGRAKLFQRVGLQVDVELGRHLYKKISKLPLKTLESKDVSSWQTAFRDVETIRGTLSGPTLITALDLPFAFLFLFLIFILSPSLVYVFAIILPLYLLLAFWSGFIITKLADTERTQALNRDMFMHEMLAGRGTVKALALERAFEPRFESTQASAIRSSMDRGASADFHQVLAQSMQLSTTVILTSVGALLILQQELSMGTLIAVNMLSARMISPIAGLVGQWRAVQNFKQALQRLSDIFALPMERPDMDLPLDRPVGAIKLENLSFSYQIDADENTSKSLNPVITINKLSGTIGPGGLHCIMGRNGAGKSTLLKLLAGLYRPHEGRVLVDEADIAQFSRRDLATWIGYLPQDCVLFADTIKRNIQVGGLPIGYNADSFDPTALNTRMIEAAKLVGSHAPILDLPDGYDTELGEAGFGLSSGQRRRIALARALMPNPPIILMDEPTSDLDNEAEEILINCLKQLSKTHTILIATHSPAIIKHADSILVLERGKVMMAGPTAQILQKISEQNKAVQAQKRQIEANEQALKANPETQTPAPVLEEASQATTAGINASKQDNALPKETNIQNARQAALEALRAKKSDRSDF